MERLEFYCLACGGDFTVEYEENEHYRVQYCSFCGEETDESIRWVSNADYDDYDDYDD